MEAVSKSIVHLRRSATIILFLTCTYTSMWYKVVKWDQITIFYSQLRSSQVLRNCHCYHFRQCKHMHIQTFTSRNTQQFFLLFMSSNFFFTDSCPLEWLHNFTSPPPPTQLAEFFTAKLTSLNFQKKKKKDQRRLPLCRDGGLIKEPLLNSQLQWCVYIKRPSSTMQVHSYNALKVFCCLIKTLVHIIWVIYRQSLVKKKYIK